MFFMPGWMISIVTFPGVIVHEMAHQLFCRVSRVAVLDVCYFRVGNPAGYVIHETPRYASQHVLIGIGPFIVNSVLGALIAAPAAIPVIQFGAGNLLDFALIWLGVSIAMHAFPSTGDAKSIWSAIVKQPAFSFARIVGTPIVGVIYLGALGSFFWVDLVYGVALAMLVPRALIALMA